MVTIIIKNISVSAKLSFLECIGTVTMMTMVKMTKMETWYVVADGGGQKDDGNPESFVLLPRFSKLVDSFFKQLPTERQNKKSCKIFINYSNVGIWHLQSSLESLKAANYDEALCLCL